MIALSVLFAATTVQAAPGELDLTFGQSGKTLIGFGFGNDIGRAVAVQADGKLVMAGYVDGSAISGTVALLLVRYDTNNALDPTFGIGGKVETPIPPGGPARAHAIRIQADGKIVVGGGWGGDFLLVRYNPDGTLDPGFGGDGIVTTDFGGGLDECRALAIQANGAIIAVGNFGHTAPGLGIAVARYLVNGQLDTSFDGDGKVTTSMSSAMGLGVAIQADGRIVAAGTSANRIAVARYLANGALDPSFDADGFLFTVIPGTVASGANAVGLRFTGPGAPEQIVVAGLARIGTNNDFAVARYEPNGALDAVFGGDGIVTTPVGAGYDEAFALEVAGGGTVTVAGSSDGVFDNDIAVVRYGTNGALDATFSGDGKVTTQVNGKVEGHAMATQAGRIVVAGTTASSSNNNDFALVRYDVDGSLDATFDGDGIKVEDVVDLEAYLNDVAIQPDGKIVAVGYAQAGFGSALVVARFTPNGALDPAFGSNGKRVLNLNAKANAVAIQPDGKIVVAGSFTGTSTIFVIVRYHADGSIDLGFGDGDGAQNVQIGPGAAVAHAIALQADGKIVLAGSASNGSNDDFAVVRYTADGFLDPSFDGDGIATTAVAGGGESAYDVKIQADGKIVLVGSAVVAGNLDFALVRYHPNGSLDNFFGSFGRVATDVGSASTDDGRALVIQPDGKLVVAGYSIGPANSDVALVRYTTAGALDPTFDGDGKLTTSIGLGHDVGIAMARQADGKLVVSGYAEIGGNVEFAVVRYDGNGVLDSGFGTGGKAVLDFEGGQDISTAIAVDAADRAVVGGWAGDRFGLTRFTGDGGLVDVPSTVPGPAIGGIRRVAPNPSAGLQAFVVEVLPGAPSLALSVYAVTGRRVWSRDLSRLSAGTHRLEWDGRMSAGGVAPPGIYFARLDGATATVPHRVVRVR